MIKCHAAVTALVAFHFNDCPDNVTLPTDHILAKSDDTVMFRTRSRWRSNGRAAVLMTLLMLATAAVLGFAGN